MKKILPLLVAIVIMVIMLISRINSGGIPEDNQPAFEENTNTPSASQVDVPSATVAQYVSKECTDTITCTLDDNGTLTLIGTGAIPNYEKGDRSQPWAEWANSITHLVVGKGITRIGDRAFQGFPNLQSAVIENDVSSIGQWAFQNCFALISVDLPPDTMLETGAFRSTPVEWDICSRPSVPYSESTYYSALSKVTLTGNYRDDVIKIALSQLGYHEGNRKADYNGFNTGGSEDYTEYGRVLGSVGNPWCSEFASWCIRTAGVPVQKVASSNSANVLYFTRNSSASWYSWDETVYSCGNYIPQSGDLLLWAWDYDTHTAEENLSHTSILVEAIAQNNGTVLLKTIDGNCNNQVAECTYEVNADDGTLIGRKGYLSYIIAPDY